jgi:flagellar biosynthesis GTPase FlhF
LCLGKKNQQEREEKRKKFQKEVVKVKEKDKKRKRDEVDDTEEDSEEDSEEEEEEDSEEEEEEEKKKKKQKQKKKTTTPKTPPKTLPKENERDVSPTMVIPLNTSMLKSVVGLFSYSSPYCPYQYVLDSAVWGLWWRVDGGQKEFTFRIKVGPTSIIITIPLPVPMSHHIQEVKMLDEQWITQEEQREMQWTVELMDGKKFLMTAGAFEKVLTSSMFGFKAQLSVLEKTFSL